jgi:hypothetical protein
MDVVGWLFLVLWPLLGLFFGLRLIFRAKRLAQEDRDMLDNSPAMYVVTGLLMVGMVVFGIVSLGSGNN